MSEIVEEIDLGGGRRLLVYDDGSRQWVEASTVVHSEGPQNRDRGTEGGLAAGLSGSGSRALHEALRATHRPSRIDPSNPVDLAWLRQQITSGNITRESRPIRSVPADEYMILLNHEGWGYQIGLRNAITFSQQITGRLGDTPIYDPAKYLWGPRGSSAARAAWRRDFARTHPMGSLLVTEDTETALADTGIPPEAALSFRSTSEFSLSDVPRGLMLISRAAMEADADIGTYFERFVARYNGDGFAGSIVTIIAGVVEFGVRFIVGIYALPAAIETLFTEARNILQAIQEALPDILQSLQDAPVETIGALQQIALEAIGQLTGISGIAEEVSTGVDVATEGRDAESSLHITRATTRVLELILVVRGLVNGLRRLPAIASRLRTQLQRINQIIPRLKAAREAARGGGAASGVLDDASSTASRGRRRTSRADADDLRSAAEDTDSPVASETAAADEVSTSPPESSTAPILPPAFHSIHETMDRLLTAAQSGREILEADLRLARALRELIQAQRRSGSIPASLTRSFLELERQIDVIEAVSHRRKVAAAGAQIFATGGTPTSLMVGDAGEEIARRILLARGYRQVMAVINRSNNGIDLIGIDRMGSVRVFEIKASRGADVPSLSAAQRNARAFVLSRLEQIASRRRGYASASDSMVATARSLLAQLERQSYVGGAVFEITHVFDISRIRVRVKPWRGTVTPHSSSWWAQLFRRMGLRSR